MSVLAGVIESAAAHAHFVAGQVRRAREDAAFRAALLERWKTIRESIGTVRTPTGLEFPAIALPETDEPGEIARVLFGDGLPGEFPFTNSVYREMYIQGSGESGRRPPEEPTRLFAGLGLAEDTNAR